MTSDRSGERWMRDSSWGVDRDATVGSDAMRWRPEPRPSVPFLEDVLERQGRRPSPGAERSPASWTRDQADELWRSVGGVLRDLPD